MTLAELREACADVAWRELCGDKHCANLCDGCSVRALIRAIPLPVETAPHVTQAAQRAEQREAWANWFENHAGDATLDTTGVERKTLLWVAKKLRTFPLPVETAPAGAIGTGVGSAVTGATRIRETGAPIPVDDAEVVALRREVVLLRGLTVEARRYLARHPPELRGHDEWSSLLARLEVLS